MTRTLKANSIAVLQSMLHSLEQENGFQWMKMVKSLKIGCVAPREVRPMKQIFNNFDFAGLSGKFY